MMQNELASRIAAGLKRKTVTTCSKWAESYRVMGTPFEGPFRFDHHPWCREMHDCDAEDMVGQKAAQMGFTEVALNKTFFTIDVEGNSVLYILPASTPDASDFSSSRFDPALELSPHLKNLFSDTKNVGHKRAGSANLFIRGSRSRSQLKSVPVSLAIADELEEMVQANVALVPERMSGQMKKQFFKLSTPTVKGYGINSHFERSTQKHFFFKCPHCNRSTQLIFPDCLVITSDDPESRDILNTHIICKECKHPLDHDSKPQWLATGEWIPAHTDRMSEGYHVSQLYSCTVKPWQLARLYIIGQTNPHDEQEFYNSKLGLPHEVEGARITDSMIEDAKSHYTTIQRGGDNRLYTMGIDVGKWLHYEICEWKLKKSTVDINLSADCRVVRAGKVLNFHELDNLMLQYNVAAAVIDANPERRAAMEFAQRFDGFVRLCIYGSGQNSRQIVVTGATDKVAIDEYTVTVDRTSWMDLALGRFKNRSISLPKDISLEYQKHLKAPVRIYDKDKDGNPIGKYVKGENEADHHAHARTYAEIALQFVSGGESQDIPA